MSYDQTIAEVGKIIIYVLLAAIFAYVFYWLYLHGKRNIDKIKKKFDDDDLLEKKSKDNIIMFGRDHNDIRKIKDAEIVNKKEQ